MRPHDWLGVWAVVSLLASSALLGAQAAQGVWRIYNSSDCTDALIGLVVLPESQTVPQEDGACTPASGDQYASYSSVAGFNLQTYAREGSGWNIHMIFDDQACGLFYSALFIGRVGECVNYQFSSVYGAGEQSFVFAECAPYHNDSLFVSFGGPNCDSIYYLAEPVRIGLEEQCVPHTTGTTTAPTYRTTHCNGAGLAPLNLTPFATSRGLSRAGWHWTVYWGTIVAWLHL